MVAVAVLGGPMLAADPAILEVDPGNGAATLRVPLGPGVGRPGLRFVPALVGKFSPVVTRSGEASGTQESNLLGVPGFEVSPGSLQLWVGPEKGLGTVPMARWTYPDGSGGTTQHGSATSTFLTSVREAGNASTGLWMMPGQGSEVLVALPPLVAGLPSGMRVERGALAFEFEREEESCPADARFARYRLAAIRTEGAEAVTFTYGPHGQDFEAVWGAARVRVTRTSGARLEVIYAGSETPSGYLLTGPEPRAPETVLRIARTDGAEQIAFRLDEASAADPAKAYPRPMILRDIDLPGRALRLEWAIQPRTLRAATDASGPETWCYGVASIRDLDRSLYFRDDPVEPGQTWVRQSRHFTLGSGPGTCRTHVRDRWELAWESAGKMERSGPDDEGDRVISGKSANTATSSWFEEMKEHIIDLGSGRVEINGQSPASITLDLRVQPGGYNDALPLIEFGNIRNILVTIKEFK